MGKFNPQYPSPACELLATTDLQVGHSVHVQLTSIPRSHLLMRTAVPITWRCLSTYAWSLTIQLEANMHLCAQCRWLHTESPSIKGLGRVYCIHKPARTQFWSGVEGCLSSTNKVLSIIFCIKMYYIDHCMHLLRTGKLHLNIPSDSKNRLATRWNLILQDFCAEDVPVSAETKE